MVLWLQPGETRAAHGAGIYTDNLAMARGLVESLTMHFPEFRGIPLAQLAYMDATCKRAFDGGRYHVDCRTSTTWIGLEWARILDRKQVVWPRFPAGPAVYDLTTLICPCEEGRIRVQGIPIEGEVRLAQTAEGTASSSAFLAFAETWVGPLD
jgi:hypothetical protein